MDEIPPQGPAPPIWAAGPLESKEGPTDWHGLAAPPGVVLVAMIPHLAWPPPAPPNVSPPGRSVGSGIDFQHSMARQ